MAPRAPGQDGPTPGGPRPRSRGSRRAGQGDSSAASSRSSRQGIGRVTAVSQSLDGQHDKPSANGEAPLDERKAQQLKQEQVAFEQTLSQDKWFFRIRLAMGIVAICAIPAAITICSLIIFDPHQDLIIKRVAESALFVSLIGLVGYVWRVFVRPGSCPFTGSERDTPTCAGG
jgi:hypothetical protein